MAYPQFETINGNKVATNTKCIVAIYETVNIRNSKSFIETTDGKSIEVKGTLNEILE